jgi:ABC-2 type transport system permease protein
MSPALTIAKREFSSLFISAVGYLVLFLFLLFMGIIFIWLIFVPGQVIELRDLANYSRFGLFFIIPLLTMSFFSEEYRSGRIEMLRTSPLSEFQLLAGKFMGAMGFYIALLAVSCIFLVLLCIFGRPDFGKVLSCYLGMTLMGLMFVSVGLFFSACTREPIVAALFAFLTLGFFTLSNYITPYVPRTVSILWMKIPLRPIFEYLTVNPHLADFARGSVELGNTVYFLGFSGLFFFWTYIVLESKKWR